MVWKDVGFLSIVTQWSVGSNSSKSCTRIEKIKVCTFFGRLFSTYDACIAFYAAITGLNCEFQSVENSLPKITLFNVQLSFNFVNCPSSYTLDAIKYLFLFLRCNKTTFFFSLLVFLINNESAVQFLSLNAWTKSKAETSLSLYFCLVNIMRDCHSNSYINLSTIISFTSKIRRNKQVSVHLFHGKEKKMLSFEGYIVVLVYDISLFLSSYFGCHAVLLNDWFISAFRTLDAKVRLLHQNLNRVNRVSGGILRLSHFMRRRWRFLLEAWALTPD